MGPGDPLVVSSYINKCSMSRPKNSRFYEKFSETAASFTIFLMFQEVASCELAVIIRTRLYCSKTFFVVYYNDFYMRT